MKIADVLNEAVNHLYDASHIVHRNGVPQDICDRVWSVAWDLEHWLKRRRENDVQGEGVDTNAEDRKED